MLILTAFSCPLHPMVRHDLGGRTSRVTVQYHLGLTVQDYWSWRLKILGVDGSSRGHKLQSFVDRLSSIYEACHVSLFDWILYRIEASLRFPCVLHIYNTLLLPHFYTFQLKHIVRAPLSTLSEHSVEHLYPSTIQPSTFSYLESDEYCYYYFL